MPNFLQNLAHAAQAKAAQAYHAVGNDIAHIGAAPHPVQTLAPQAQQQIQNARYGVLAHNPALQQRVVSNLARPVAQPSIGTGLGNLGNSFNNATAGLGKQVLHFGTQTAGDIAATIAQHPITPWTPAGGAAGRDYLYGQQTFKPVIGGGQNGLYDSTRNHFQQSSNPVLHNPLVAKALAAGDVGLHVLNDVPIAGAALKAGVKGSAKAAPTVVKAAEQFAPKAVPVLQKGAEGLQATANTLDKGAVATAKAANNIRTAGKTKLSSNSAIGSEVSSRNQQIKSLKKLQADTPIGSVASENYQAKIDNHQAVINNLLQGKQKLTIPERLMNQHIGNTVGGPNALKYQLAKKQGRVFEGVDGKPRFEIDDSKAVVKQPQNLTSYPQGHPAAHLQQTELGDVLHHPELYKQYPDLKQAIFTIDHNMVGSGKAQGFRGISVRPDVMDNPEQARKVILHETQHLIQGKENFAKGGSPDEFPRFNGDDTTQVMSQQIKTLESSPEYKQYEAAATNASDKQFDTLTKQFDASEFGKKYNQLNQKLNEYKQSQQPSDKYWRQGGEAEARAVEARANLPDSQRYIKSEPSYKDLAAQGIHKVPNLPNHQLDNLSPEAIDALKSRGFKGVSNGKRTVRFEEQSYRDGHQIDQSAIRLASNVDNLDEVVKGIQGKYGLTKTDYTDISKLKKIQGNPEADVTIYRAAPKNELNGGDWVTTNKDYAKSIAGENGGKVHSFTVKAKELNYPHNVEDLPSRARFAAFSYKPEATAPKSQPATSLRSTFYDSLDVPKDQLIIRKGGGTAMSIDKRAYAEDLSPEQNKAIAQYAEFLKEVGQGNGVDFHPDGRKLSNNFRGAELKGKKSVTNTEWFDQARKDLESGKADSYAVEDYKAQPGLKKPTAAAPSTKPAPVSPKPAAKPQLPASRGTVSGSSVKSILQDKMTPDSYAKTFGVPKEQAAKELAPKQLTNAEKADLSSKEQMLLHSADTPLRTPEQNRALNPVKSDLQHIAPGNHDAAITQAQMVQNHIELHKTQVLSAFDKLSKDEQSNFMRSVEKLPNNASHNLEEAVRRWRTGADTVHAHSQSEFMGGNTNYLKNYALHSWDLPTEFTDSNKMESLINGGGKNFQGLNNISRKHMTIAEGEQSGLKLNADPKDVRKQIDSYFGASGNALRKQALRQGFTEADAGNMEKVGHLNVGVGDTVPLSKQGMKAASGVQWAPKSTNKAVVAYRKANRGAVSVLLTHSGVHEMNITSRAAPGLALKGHPLAALKAAAGGVRGNVDKAYIDHIRQTALTDGTANKAAMIGAPYSTGHGLLDKQLTPIHNQVVRSVIRDLEKKGIPLTSKAARNAGKAANGMMGEVNYAVMHLSPQHSRLLGDLFLAKQFTPSKFVRAHQAVTDKGLGGNYARATMAGNALMATATIAGLGYAFKQKSDNVKDSLLRALIAPAVPTPIKDKQGNNQQIKLLGTDTSDIAKLLGITLNRNNDGHLGVSFNPKNLPTTTADYLRSRLAPILGDGLKVATNTNYAGKPLYDPNAPGGTQAIQAGTTLAVGHLPIAAQTLAYSNAVKSHLPGSAKTILDANTPKANVATNAALGLVGGAIANDKTVGKGLQTAQAFAASDAAKKGLTPNQLALYNAVHPQTKNPVTGSFQTAPSIYDSQQKATTYLKGPDGAAVLAADNKLNQTLKSNGQQIDPFYNLNPDQQRIALNYSALAQGDTRRSNFLKAYPFLTQLSSDRNSFFSSLPAGKANDTAGNSKAQLPASLQYPNLTAAEQALTDKYYNTTSPTIKNQLLKDPAMAAAVGKVKNYSANIAAARDIPTASQIPGSTPPVPKNPNSKSTGGGSKTTYDPNTKTWTRVAAKSGKTTVISADGTRTVTNQGVSTKKGKTYKSNLGATIKAAKGTGFNTSKYKVAKVSLSSKLGSKTAMAKYSTKKLTLNKKA